MSSGVARHVFVSYSHDSEEHSNRVLEFCERLRRDGVDACVDRYEPAPPKGWVRWMRDEVERADFIVAVFTETYRRRYEGRETPGEGSGATFEGLLLSQLFYEQGAENRRLVPLIFEGDPERLLPVELRSFRRYLFPRDYEDLYRLLSDQSRPGVLPPVSKGLVRSEGLPSSEAVLDPEHRLEGAWRHVGPLGWGHRLQLSRKRPFLYTFQEYFFGRESGSGAAHFDTEELSVKGVNTLAGSFSGRLRLVGDRLVGSIEGQRISRWFGNITLERLAGRGLSGFIA